MQPYHNNKKGSPCYLRAIALIMNIIIVGCGKVGQTLAEQLNEEGNNITVIDTVQSKVVL